MATTNIRRFLLSIVVTLWCTTKGIEGKSATNSSNTTTTNSSNATNTTSLWIGCRLCSSVNATLGDPQARFQQLENVLTCQQVYDMGAIQLSSTDCNGLQTLGSTLCLCSADNQNSTTNSVNNCSLCDDGSPLPFPTYEGLPSTTCAQLQVEAKRDDPSLCSTYQKTVGVYCQCNNTVTSRDDACQLCGQFPLPNPLLEANSTNQSSKVTQVARSSSSSSSSSSALISCGEVEFQASRPGSNCTDFQQLYGDACCQNLVVPTFAPKSAARQQQPRPLSNWIFLSICLVTVRAFCVR